METFYDAAELRSIAGVILSEQTDARGGHADEVFWSEGGWTDGGPRRAADSAFADLGRGRGSIEVKGEGVGFLSRAP